jgi:hypothetical protein
MAIGLDLDQYQLNRRVLLVFAPNPDDVRYEEQHRYLKDEKDLLDEWRVVEFGIFEDGPSFAEQRAVSREDSERARARFGLEKGAFRLSLLDLDGTEILSSSEPIPVEDVIEVIEAKGVGRGR